ncbi:unnamed protein product [Lactuca virosa]|uniref:MHD1 domain-containing protein n=1 Tax=Lactuca virosa TaxID=75947 RepID=A0AAU9NXK0_9ASTR|nr:unnamed protein product [Lactuca virosa]
MASLFSRERILGQSKRDSNGPVMNGTNSLRYSSSAAATTTTTTLDPLPSPFGDLTPTLSPTDLRETAYEIFVAACRTSTGKPLTYIPNNASSYTPDRSSQSPSLSGSPSQRSITSTAASKMKKALGLRSSSSAGSPGSAGSGAGSGGKVKKTVMTVGELMRIQMRISEAADSRVRRALLRISAGQVGKRVELMVLPLELLQQFKSSDFTDQQEYATWQKRNLKMLEAGLLLHPHIPLPPSNTSSQRLKQIIHNALEKTIETGRNNESMQVLRSAVTTLSNRSTDGQTESCHWADGFPLNLRIYEILLEAIFDLNDESSIIEEVDEVMELVKKTWGILGINQMLHNICFTWILFNRFVGSGQMDNDLLYAADCQLVEVAKDAKTTKDANYAKILNETLSEILGWAEKRLLAYHDTFDKGNINSMQREEGRMMTWQKSRTDTYIRSSLRTAFAQIMEKADSIRRASRNQPNPLPVLAILAKDIGELATKEKKMFSPILKRWHPLAAGVAVATLHVCYGNELKQFISGITELTPDAVQILRAADKLEKDLVQIAVEDSVDSDDGGKAIIREMPPFEAEAAIANLVKGWTKLRLDRLKEWIDRNLQQEVWNPRANQEGYAPSAVEVLRIIDETLDAFFNLPIPMHPALLPDLVLGLDRCLQYYSNKVKSGCGSRNTYIPALPALTRCTTETKFHGVFKKKEKTTTLQRRNSQVSTTNDNTLGVPQLCVRGPTCSPIEPFLQELEQNLTVIADNVQHERVRTRLVAEVMKASFEGLLLVLLGGGPTRCFTIQDSRGIEDDFKAIKDLFFANGDGLSMDVINKFSIVVRDVIPLFGMETDAVVERFRRLTLEAYGSSAKSRLPLPATTGQWSSNDPNTLLRVLCYRNDDSASKFLKKTYNLPKKI